MERQLSTDTAFIITIMGISTGLTGVLIYNLSPNNCCRVIGEAYMLVGVYGVFFPVVTLSLQAIGV